MKKSDLQAIIHGFRREDLPMLIEIDSYDSLIYHIPYIERLVRSSDYYDIWRAWNKSHEEANTDIIENLDISELKRTKIELHHFPLTLFDIVQYIGRKLLDDKEKTNPFEIAKLVLEEHLLGNIGYVPLLITHHQKYHDGILDLDMNKIKGNYKEFERKYL